MLSKTHGCPELRHARGRHRYGFIGTLQNLRYQYRDDIRDRAAPEKNFRDKFEALNRVRLTDTEFSRLLEEIVTPDVFTAAKTLCSINTYTRDDGTSLNYSLVNLKDWCKNTFEVIHQMRINTDYSHHSYDVILHINGVPCVQIELKILGVNLHGRWSRSSNTSTTPVTATPGRCSASCERFLQKCDLGQTLSRYMVLLAGDQQLNAALSGLCRAAHDSGFDDHGRLTPPCRLVSARL